jgi:hypothetical protein
MELARGRYAMPPPSLSTHVLNRALALVGSTRKLAHRLRVPSAELQAWLAGEDRPPLAVFLEAVDVILSAQEDPLLTDAAHYRSVEADHLHPVRALSGRELA